MSTSEEAVTLLRRADEAVGREDWKVVADALQRIIGLPGEHLVASDDHRFISARSHAHRRIAALPLAGLEAYRLVYDGEAAALLARAKTEHDIGTLRTVVDQYLLTRSGDDATMTLADWLIDEGRFAEASRVLADLAIYPDTDQPAWVVAGRRAICSAAVGRTQRATAILDEFERIAATQPTNTPADVRKKRLAQVRSYIESVRPHRIASESWAMAMGNPSRNGRMPAVEPALIEDLPWRVGLPIEEPRMGFGALSDYAHERKLLPVRNGVTDGRLLIAKGERQLLALDLGTFQPVWTSQEATSDENADASATTPGEVIQLQPVRVWVGSGRVSNWNTLDRHPLAHRLLRDTVGSEITLAFDLALTVEWPDEPPQPVAGTQVRGRGVTMGGPSNPSKTNRIAAYSIADGTLKWQTRIKKPKAVEGEAETVSLGAVEFLAAPVPVGDELLAVFRVNADLYAAVLDPSSGRIVRRIFLCGIGGGPFASLNALQPCVSDGMVFIPTARGLLVALDSSDWSIRWAARYDSVSGSGWLPAPVMAVSDVVLLAPTDANALLCFDRASGRLRWQADRKNGRYVLAVSDRAAWIVGEALRKCDIETGETTWEQPVAPATGKGVLASDTIYLPTAEGLQAFEAESGKPITIDQSANGAPLGNLLSWNAALYSVSLFEVRKYPDLTRGYEQALAAVQAEPTHAANAIRLAWLELLKTRPDKALAALSQVPESWRDRDPGQYAHLQHLRVHALLEMADAQGTSQDQALELLQRARDLVEAPEDVIKVSLKLGDFYGDTHREAEACEAYLSLVLSDMGEVLIEVGDGLEKRARGVAVRHLADTLHRMPDADRQAVIRQAESWLEDKVEEEAFARLDRLTEFDALGSLASKADLLLGQWASRELQFEQAENRYRKVIRQSDSPTLVAEATARLAAIYLEPDELHQPVSALQLIDRLEHEYAAIELPADLLEVEAPIAVSASGKKMSGARIAAALGERLDPDILARHQSAMTPVNLGPPQEPSIHHQDNARPLTVRGDRKEPLAESLMRLREGKTIEVRSVEQNAIRWSTELRLLGEEAIDTMQTAAVFGRQQPFGQYPFDFTRAGRGVLDGQTLVVNTGYGLHAVGLLTGRRLWSRRYWPPQTTREVRDTIASDAWLWVHNGYVVTVDGRGRIEVAPLDQGERILWRALQPKRGWHYVRVRGDYVVVADKKLEHIDVFRLSDGQYLGQCAFTQSIGRRISISLFDEVICGPASDHKIMAVDLKAPGIERWQTVMPRALSQVFKPTPNLLAVADRSGNLRIIDPNSGQPIVDTHVEPCAAGVVEGVMHEDRLYVFGYKKRANEPAKTITDQDVAVAAIDLKSGGLLWGRSGLSSWTTISHSVLKSSANAIPLVALEPPEPEQRQRGIRHHSGQPAKLRIKLIDKRNGKFIGKAVSVTLNESPMTRRILDIQAWPGRIIVRAGSLQVEFPCPVKEGRQVRASKGNDERS